MPIPPNLRPVRARSWQRITKAVPTTTTPAEAVARLEAAEAAAAAEAALAVTAPPKTDVTTKIIPLRMAHEFFLQLLQPNLMPEIPPLIPIPNGYWLLIGKNPAQEMPSSLCLLIPDPSISRLHAAISVNAGSVYLYDYNSTNGCCIIQNGKEKRVKEGPHEVPRGAHICIGSCFFNIVERR